MKIKLSKSDCYSKLFDICLTIAIPVLLVIVAFKVFGALAGIIALLIGLFIGRLFIGTAVKVIGEYRQHVSSQITLEVIVLAFTEPSVLQDIITPKKRINPEKKEKAKSKSKSSK